MLAPQLFVLVSTRQNIANLPPLLEHANPGDHVLWIESAEARRGRWSENARRVLHERGLVQHPAVEVDHVNDPSQVVAACWDVVHQFRAAKPAVFLVANGGNKMTPLGMLLGLRELAPVVLYGDDKPVVCWTFEGSFANPPEIRPYRRHNIDLPDILRLSGHEIGNPDTALLFWPGPAPAAIAAEPYGQDPHFTSRIHAEHHEWGKSVPTGGSVHFKDLPRYLPPDRVSRWRRSVHDAVASPNPESEHSLSVLYSATRNLAEEAAAARDKSLAGMSRPAATVGDAFERAVALRTHAWLEKVRQAAVQSAWFNVIVHRNNQEVVQFDVVLVLRNGILLQIECKSFTAEKKDLDARLFNLQRASSQLARMAVCAPLLTHHAGEPWFAALHALRGLIEPRGQPPYLPFTLPGQPPTYAWPNGAAEAQNWSCPCFEDCLADLLDEYEPDFTPGA